MLNVVSGCTGAGGLDLGLKWTERFRSVAYIENDPAQLVLLIGAIRRGDLDMAPIWTDFKTFDGRPWRGRVDCFAAGIPCQPHSHAGKRARGADSRNLWPDGKRIIGEMAPRIVIIENVEGLYTGEAAYGPEVAADLYAMGYVVVIGYKSAAEVGAPHQRMRTFTIGILPDTDCSRSAPSWQDRGVGWSGQQVPHLADSTCSGQQGRDQVWSGQPEPFGRCAIGDASSARLQDVQGSGEDAGEPRHRTPDGPGWWDVEPGMGRVANGVPHRVHRLRGLGNAVVPQVARSIGEEILAFIGTREAPEE